MSQPIIGLSLDREPAGGYSKTHPWYALRENYCDAEVAHELCVPPCFDLQWHLVSTAHILSLVGIRPVSPKSVSKPALVAIVRRVLGVK